MAKQKRRWYHDHHFHLLDGQIVSVTHRSCRQYSCWFGVGCRNPTYHQEESRIAMSTRRSWRLSRLALLVGWIVALYLSSYDMVVVFASAEHHHHHDRKQQDDSSSDPFYKRYDVYPPYCGDPIEMQRRKIPDLVLPSSSSSGSSSGVFDINTRLEHVSVMIRHGARTPTHGNHHCWPGFWDAPQGVWDCDLTTVMLATGPNPDTMVGPKNDGDDDDNGGIFFVQKVYDAFIERSDSTLDHDVVFSPYKNHLNGTCQAGQLIRQGYDQQVTNGQLLRERYIYDGSKQDDDDDDKNARLRLFDTSDILKDNNRDDTSGSSSTTTTTMDYPFSRQNLRYRSDDDQRTVASGQVLLQSLFGPELRAFVTRNNGRQPIIDHHTADRSLDILDAHRDDNDLCNRIFQTIEDKAHSSDEYRRFNQSDESILMGQLIDNEFSHPTSFTQDCMMTAICTDRPIPDVINDYKGENHDDTTTSDGEGMDDGDIYTQKYGRNRFVRLRDYVSVADHLFVQWFLLWLIRK